MALDKTVKRVWGYIFTLVFVVAVIGFGYFVFQKVFYPNRVKVTVINRQTNKPITSHKITLKKVCDLGVDCEPHVIYEAKTNIFGNFTLSTKDITDSFEVIADGFKTDGPWLKRPGSLSFSRQYSDQDFYSVNISQSGLDIKLEPQ